MSQALQVTVRTIFWEAVTGDEGELRIQPRRWGKLALLMSLISAAILAVVIALVPMDFVYLTITLVIGLDFVLAFPVFLLVIDRRQQKQGPYIIMDREGIRLRNGYDVAWDRFETFDFMSQGQGSEARGFCWLVVKNMARDTIKAAPGTRTKLDLLKDQLEQWMTMNRVERG